MNANHDAARRVSLTCGRVEHHMSHPRRRGFKKMSKRMGIGEFQQLFVDSASVNAHIGTVNGEVDLVQAGPKLKRARAEKLGEKLTKIISKELTGARA